MGLCSELCGSLDGRGIGGEMDTCLCMVESFCCPPETITILLISQTSIQNKKLLKKNPLPSLGWKTSLIWISFGIHWSEIYGMPTKLQHSLKDNGHGTFGETKIGEPGGRAFFQPVCLCWLYHKPNKQAVAGQLERMKKEASPWGGLSSSKKLWGLEDQNQDKRLIKMMKYTDKDHFQKWL